MVFSLNAQIDTTHEVSVSENSTVYDFAMLLFVSYDVDGSEPVLQEKKFNFPIVSGALGFSDKYGVFSFPSYILVDEEGLYRGTFDDLEVLLKEL